MIAAQQTFVELIAGAAIGASVGAFAATAGIRLAQGRDPWQGRSCCDGCHCQLSSLETLPIIGFIVLRGRCRTCAAPIDGLHPVSEILGAILLPLSLYLVPGVDGILLGAITALLLTTAIVDLRTLRLLDVFTIPIAILAGVLAWRQHALLGGLVTCALAGACLYGLKRFLERRRGQPMLGLGDIKLTMALAIGLGERLPIMLTLAALLGIGTSPFLKRKPLPFGPMLASAFWGVYVLGILANPF